MRGSCLVHTLSVEDLLAAAGSEDTTEIWNTYVASYLSVPDAIVSVGVFTPCATLSKAKLGPSSCDHLYASGFEEKVSAAAQLLGNSTSTWSSSVSLTNTVIVSCP